jgi:hypothetical protein
MIGRAQLQSEVISQPGSNIGSSSLREKNRSQMRTLKSILMRPHPRIGALHTLQGLFAGSRVPIKAQPFGRAADNEDIGDRSAVNVVAGAADATEAVQGGRIELINGAFLKAGGKP